MKHPRNKPKEITKLIDITIEICDVLKKSRHQIFMVTEYLKFFRQFGELPTRCPVRRFSCLLENNFVNFIII